MKNEKRPEGTRHTGRLTGLTRDSQSLFRPSPGSDRVVRASVIIVELQELCQASNRPNWPGIEQFLLRHRKKLQRRAGKNHPEVHDVRTRQAGLQQVAGFGKVRICVVPEQVAEGVAAAI